MLDRKSLLVELKNLGVQKHQLRDAYNQAVGYEQAYIDIISRLEDDQPSSKEEEVKNEPEVVEAVDEEEWPEACDIP